MVGMTSSVLDTQVEVKRNSLYKNMSLGWHLIDEFYTLKKLFFSMLNTVPSNNIVTIVIKSSNSFIKCTMRVGLVKLHHLAYKHTSSAIFGCMLAIND